jgi:uncharacterized protein YciI
MMFLVTAWDFTDAGAFDRRMAARGEHLAMLNELKAEGKLRYALAMSDGEGKKLIGSTVVYECATREELDLILAREPYVTRKVWDRVDVTPCRVAPMFA